MWKKHLTGIFISLLVFSICIDFFPHVSDERMISRFHRRRDNFRKLWHMAKEDSKMTTVDQDFVVLNGNVPWLNDGQEGFSTERWNQYRELFGNLRSDSIHSISKDGDVLKICCASISFTNLDGYERFVSSKGYAFCLRNPTPLVDSLDKVGAKSDGTYFKNIEGHWFLYLEQGVTKPE